MSAVLQPDKGVDVETDDVPRLSKTVRARLIRVSAKPEELEFDKERARRVLGLIYEQSPYKIETHAPQYNQRPRSMEFGSLEHRIWLWSSATTDLRTESDRVYHAHAQLWNNERTQLPFVDTRSTRELYGPESLEWTREDYIQGLAKCRFGNPKRNIDWWPRRSRLLWEAWGGDTFLMFQSGSIDAVMREKENGRLDLPGVGPKIASLIAIFFEQIGMPPVPDAFPVDVHVQRLALALRLIVPKRPVPILNETLEHVLRREIIVLCREEGWSRIGLSHALWFKGHFACTTCWRTSHAAVTCPVVADCQGVYSSRAYFKMGLWLPTERPWARGGLAPWVPFEERSLFLGKPHEIDD